MQRSLPRRRHPRGDDDAGFTLIEVMVSVAIVAVVMLGLGAVFVATAAGTDAQGLRQAAARIATDGLDRAHALSGSAIVKGRDQSSVATQWASRPKGVSGLLSGLTYAYDPAAVANTGRVAALPTKPLASVVDGVTYQQSFYVAGCQLDAAQKCLAAVTSGTVPMFDVVVSVAWRDRTCPTGTCTYELSTLLASNTTEPLFNSNLKALAPVVGMVNGLTQQLTDITETITAANGPKVTVTGGNGAVTLTATGQPNGVTLDPNTGTFTGTLSALTTGTTVTVTATDRFGLFSSTTFTWIVNPLPKLNSAALPLVAGLLQTVDLASALKLTGGTGPYTWACTGLSLGATLNATTGLLSIPAAALGLLSPTCTATDSRGQASAATLSASVLAPLTIVTPANNSTATIVKLTGITSTAIATGCSGTCTWSATGLPAGVIVTAAGLISGKPTTTGTYKPVFTVRDGANRSTTSTVTWTVR